MKTISAFIFALLLLMAGSCCRQRDFTVTSPDGTISVAVHAGDSLTYAVMHRGVPVLNSSRIALSFCDGTTTKGRIAEVQEGRVSDTIEAPFYRQARFDETYNYLQIAFDDGISVTFRVYDEGCAYRFEIRTQGERCIENEVAEFNFAGDPSLFVAYSDGLCNAFQYCYTKTPLSELKREIPILTPMAADCAEAGRVLICESDVEAYPGMFLTRSDRGVKGLFAQVPDSTYLHERRCQEKVGTRRDYIASAQGPRSFPWRMVIVADTDAELPVNNLVYALGAENRIGDPSWVKPGKVAWEWWNDWGLMDVGFKPGLNTRTYKAYIDFAAEYGVEYVVLDEGWSDPKGGDVMSVIPGLDLPELTRYASKKGVGLWLWVVGNVLDSKLEEACAYYSQLGIKGFKVDFIDRDDQLAVELVYRIARVAASHHLMLDLHGMYKPTGLNRTYPHIVNFEGVFGMEELKWSNPDMPAYDVTFPFIRMVQGPVDYTSGAFLNATKEGFEIDYNRPMSQGTRAHQAATYVVFDAPLAMLCDSPSRYRSEDDCCRYITSLPTVFDTTRILSGKIGEYIVTAREKDGVWYVGGLTDWTPRTLELDLPMLTQGEEYTASMLCDTDASAITPSKYAIRNIALKGGEKLSVPLAPGGGFVLKITRK